MSSIEHHLTELYVFIDDFLTAHPALAHGRQSPHDQPAFADTEVLTIGLLQGCLGGASVKQTYRLVAYNYRSAFPRLCSYQQWMARLQALTAPIRALLSATMQTQWTALLSIWSMPSPCPSVIGCGTDGYAYCARR